MADTETIGGSVNADTPMSNVPEPVFPIGAPITRFTGYSDEPFQYITGGFSVNLSGVYTATLESSAIQNGIYLLRNLFSPSEGTPATPLSDFLVFTQNGNTTTVSFHLKAGAVYSYLGIFSLGTSPFTFALDGPGCIALTTTCWIDKSKTYFVETDSRARGEFIVFDGGILRPTTATVFAQPVTLLDTGAIVDTTTAGTVTMSGNIVGQGGLTVRGGNLLVLLGKNTYSGGTTIESGTLIGTPESFGKGHIFNQGNLILDQNEDGTFKNILSGNGTFTKIGKGDLTLTGTHPLTGPTYIQSGDLMLDGALPSSVVTIGRGVGLSGDGIVGGLLTETGSVISPGNSTGKAIGQITVRGDAVLGRRTTYAIDVDGSGRSDRIQASGYIRISPRVTLELSLIDGQFQAAVPYVILKSKRRIRGRFNKIEEVLPPFLEPTLEYTSKTVTLTLVPKNTMADLHGSTATSAYADASVLQGVILSRLARSNSFSTDQTEWSGTDGSLWGESFNSWGTLRRDSRAPSLDRTIGGFVIGAEARPSPLTTFGIAGGFSRSEYDIDMQASSGENESLFGIAYGKLEWNAFRLSLGASLAYQDIDAKRTVTLPGYTEVPQTSYDGITRQVFGEAGYVFGTEDFQVEPFAGASALRLHMGNFREDGGPSALNGYSEDYNLLTSTLGMRLRAQTNPEAPITLNAMLGWRRAYGDLAPEVLLGAQVGSSTFITSGLALEKDTLVAEIGLDLQASSDISFGVAYQGQMGARTQEHAVKGNLTWNF
ncbi:autotransporter domain-containing protein [Microvirga sp. 2YAF29]|uniref:autotransporter outer membrane beta-barrel domain-containing protein n=1 Tax=Microvirga sp. 2YAF29 TaxID=3233031 RepID=UPI003F9BBDE3